MHTHRTSLKTLTPAIALMALLLPAGCGGGGSSATPYVVGAKLSENGTVDVAQVVGINGVTGQSVLLSGDSGRTYLGTIPTDLQTNGQRVHFTATVTSINAPGGDAPGDSIDITEIHAIASK